MFRCFCRVSASDVAGINDVDQKTIEHYYIDITVLFSVPASRALLRQLVVGKHEDAYSSIGLHVHQRLTDEALPSMPSP